MSEKERLKFSSEAVMCWMMYKGKDPKASPWNSKVRSKAHLSLLLPTAVRMMSFLFLPTFHHQAWADSLIICARYVWATWGELGRKIKTE